MSRIPIDNIYYMLCYAWDVLPESTATDVTKLASQKPVDLFAQMLINGTNHMLRRGIDQSYVNTDEITASLKGRIDFAGSARRMLLQQGRARCEFDELSPNILSNQILKATLYRLARTEELDKKLKRQCSLLVRRFHQVEDIRLTRTMFHRVQLNANNRFYRFLLHLCELVFDCSLVHEQSGEYKFRDVLREDKPMARLYEKFIFNFFKREQTDYKVSSDRIYWRAESTSDTSLAYLPSMLTDISLRSDQRTIIVDAKYYGNTLQANFGRETIHSGNLYQIYAYLKNLEIKGGSDARAEGVLLYPVTAETHDHSYDIDGHRVRVMTLNLASPWQEIERQLFQLVA